MECLLPSLVRKLCLFRYYDCPSFFAGWDFPSYYYLCFLSHYLSKTSKPRASSRKAERASAREARVQSKSVAFSAYTSKKKIWSEKNSFYIFILLEFILREIFLKCQGCLWICQETQRKDCRSCGWNSGCRRTHIRCRKKLGQAERHEGSIFWWPCERYNGYDFECVECRVPISHRSGCDRRSCGCWIRRVETLLCLSRMRRFRFDQGTLPFQFA